MPVWRISLFTNVNLVIVIAVSVGLQAWNQHNSTLGRFPNTSFMSLADCLLFLAMSTIPLLILKMVKVVRHIRRHRKTESDEYAKST